MTASLRDRRVIRSLRRCVVLAVALVLAAAASPAGAVEIEDRGTAGLDGKVVMSPATERIETVTPDGGEQIGPGSTVRRAVIIHNRTDDQVAFDLGVAQVVGSTAELVVDVREGVREGAAAWVELEDTSFTLKPGQQAVVGVTIRIPRTVKPGSKPFAITATQRSGAVETTGAGIAPQFRQVGIFILELPGDAPVEGRFTEATITSAQKSEAAGREGRRAPTNDRFYVSPGWTDAHDLRLTTEYVNEGERLLRPSGRVVVRDVFGRVAGRYEIDGFTVYPGGQAAERIELRGLPSLGLFTAHVEIESEAGGSQETTLPRFLLLPKWLVVVLVAFALYALYHLVRWQLRRSREWKRYLAEGDEPGPEALDAEAWEADAALASDDVERI